jgi:hypothetical protein
VSQYIANLNQLSPPSDNLADPQPVNDDFSAFLNNDFFDINGGTNIDINSPIDFGVDFDIKPSTQPTAENSPRNSISAASTKPNMDFSLNGKSAVLYSRCACRSFILSTIPSFPSLSTWPEVLHAVPANHSCSSDMHTPHQFPQPLICRGTLQPGR